jgi:serine/threonine-protein kinase HipA
MISKDDYKEAYVWIWLPGETKPVVAGVLQRDEDRLLFNYGKSYLARKNAISIYDPELPLRSGDMASQCLAAFGMAPPTPGDAAS